MEASDRCKTCGKRYEVEWDLDDIWRAYLIGINYGRTNRTMGIGALIDALRSDESFDKACETREETLERQLRDERKALRALEAAGNPV